MLQNLQKLFLRLIFRLIDGPTFIHQATEKEKEQIRKWMIDCYANPGYQLYHKYREAKFIITLSDLGMDAQPRDKYIRVIGQRFEILRWNDTMRKVFDANSKAERAKQNLKTE